MHTYINTSGIPNGLNIFSCESSLKQVNEIQEKCLNFILKYTTEKFRYLFS